MCEVSIVERTLILVKINAERLKQDAQWGGSIHDDSHGAFEWCEFVRKQIHLAGSCQFGSVEPDAIAFEGRMVKVAALAVAAIESSRRQRGAAPVYRAESE